MMLLLFLLSLLLFEITFLDACIFIVGCFARILTTLQLTKDRLALLGYIFGFATNAVLLLQIIIYN
jgi:hypothetical protein